MPDPALEWLFANDPLAKRVDRQTYLERTGILLDDSDPDHHDVALVTDAVAHCDGCERRAATAEAVA